MRGNLGGRGAFSNKGNLCCDGSVVAVVTLDHYNKLDDIDCKYHFYPRTASHIFNRSKYYASSSFFFLAEDGIRDPLVTGVQTCALPIFKIVRCTRCVQLQFAFMHMDVTIL